MNETLDILLSQVQFLTEKVVALSTNLEALRYEVRKGGSWVSITEAASLENVDKATIRRWITSGKLKQNASKKVWIGDAPPPTRGRPKRQGMYPTN